MHVILRDGKKPRERYALSRGFFVSNRERTSGDEDGRCRER
jgi:hypothetical protein